jgi:FdhD protein
MSGRNGSTRRERLTTRGLLRLGAGRRADEDDALAVEEPLEIRVDGETVAVTMRTPGEDADLALGFLFAEGLIAGARDVGSVAHCGRLGDDGHGNVVDVRSAGGHRIDAERILEGQRWVTTSSACGVCGRRSIEQLVQRCGVVEVPTRLTADAVAATVRRLAEVQPTFARTGGLHAAAIHADDGARLAAAEDVGRHNAVDKAVGALLRRGVVGAPPRAAGLAGTVDGVPGPALLAVSGRASFEIVQKAAAARIPLVASVSAPTSLAVDLAQATGIALLGFVREGRLNVYTHAWRLEPAATPAREAAPLGSSPP